MKLQCGLLGEKLGHSYSPQIHRQLGDYEYNLYEKAPDQLEAFLLHGDWTGLNVTIPYKKSVLPFCQELSEVAKAVGSVNTLVKRPDGTIYGDNTDAYGFWFLLKQNKIDPSGKKALILGNGGACASIRYVLERSGAQVVVISRRGENRYDNLDKHRDASLIVNTTPVGMYPENGRAPLDLQSFARPEAVLDIIYNPARTALMLQAEELGIQTDNGLSMLVAQASKSSREFLQREAPRFTGPAAWETDWDTEGPALIRKIYRQMSLDMQNLILVGMPGSGKSRVAGMLGELTGREVLELDQLFTERFGLTPEACILQFGEEAFRQKETEVIRSAGQCSGKILSTGGGCVTRPENYPLLHQNGVIVWIRRDPDKLTTAGRPLSQKTGVKALYAIRRPMYEAFADFYVENHGTVRQTAEMILAELSSGTRD